MPAANRNPSAEDIPNADYRQLNRELLTPMMQHYADLKDKYPNNILLYRVGDFFECFFMDAITVSRELELVCTSKESGKGIGRVPMTGVPHHALERYSTQLLEKGYGVVICDQVEDAATAHAEKRMVRREVQKVLTPGTLTDDGMLRARQNNYLAAVVIAGNHWGLAYADISTGEFCTTQAQDLAALNLELLRLQPSEVLYPSDAPDLNRLMRPGDRQKLLQNHLPACLPSDFCYALRSPREFDLNEAKPKLLMTFQWRSLEGVGCEHLPLAVRAAGGLLAYVEETQQAYKVPFESLKTYSIDAFLQLDHQTRRNLEITQTVRDGSFYGSLLWALDVTCTNMGGRALRRWLLQPLLDPKAIAKRLDSVAELVENTNLRQDIRQLLKQIYDLERIAGRIGSGSANARDLYALAESLTKLTYLAELATEGRSPYLQAVKDFPPELEALGQHVLQYLVDSPPIHIKEGGLIRDGVDENLDFLRRSQVEDREWLANLEITERERTGVSKLKVGYNKTFGYYISLPRSQADKAPDEYLRKQTLANEERYITPELKERESRILTAKDDICSLEYEIFATLRAKVAEHTDQIRTTAKAIAALDVLTSFAETAVYQGYCCPEITTEKTLEIEAGRHPVVEKSLGMGLFVPNSTYLGRTQNSYPDLIILTGPNASGKSCYLRQTGLIQLMAQVGSFVPAQNAVIPICDRIFTRVGAVDDLATGQSTFMVEMNETANILNHATEKSLVLIDEIGRGTATFDGLSIAWSVSEYLATEIKAKTIFATHYHELNELASLLENVANYQVTVQEMPEEIIFLHQVRPGGADRSYGIEAGRLAGLPKSVIQRAKQVMTQIEKHSKIAVGLRKGIPKKITTTTPEDPQRVSEQLNIFKV
ncbi:DNA mismatch repair protein MutS [Synechococcus sp. BDU 130192]|uniref:DNA mismatch repair protein MutS n=1 Tax=Synechococcus sp. BDU 130192 TaxID=2042059 RepID=UPI000C085BD5|nr:DNA mismatch repair protein MutS [Synechococcus sp. BDU 130192]